MARKRRRKTKSRPRGGGVREWMEEQYRKKPGLREEVAEMVAAMELEDGLVSLREERGVSQTQLARMLGVSQPAIAKLESGSARDVKLSTLIRYTRALGGRVRVEITKDPNWAKVVPIRRAAGSGSRSLAGPR